MKLTVDNFRSVSHSELHFPKELSLFKAESGRGKSSHLDSILFCLYGKLKNVSSNTKRTTVTIELNNINISRTRKPNTLKVIYEEKEYNNEEAQIIIDKLFGIKEVFLAASYIRQGYRNILCDSHPPVEVIRKIAMKEDITEINKKIEDKLSETKRHSSNIEVSLQTMKPFLHDMEEKYSDISSWIFYQEEQNISELVKLKIKLKIKRDIQLKDIERQNTLKNFKLIDVLEIEEKLKVKKEECSSIIIPENAIPYDVYQITLKEFEEKLSSISVENDEKCILEQLKKSKVNRDNILHNQATLNLVKVSSKENLEIKITLRCNELDKSNKTIKTMESKIDYPTLKCPGCHISLQYTGDELKKLGRAKKGKRYKLEEIEIKKKEIYELNSSLKLLNDAKDKLSVVVDDTLDKLEEELSNLKEKKRIQKELDNHKKKKTYNKEDLLRKNTLETEIKELESSIRKAKENNSKIENLYKDTDITETDINETNKRIKENEEDIESFKENQRKKEIKTRYSKYKEKYNNKENDLSTYNKKIENITFLKYTSKEVEGNILYNCIKRINIYIAEIIEELFELPIRIELSMEKSNTNGQVVSRFNINILYNKIDYKTPLELSGGELDRVSLAITLALSRVTGSRILLLDECIASLGDELVQSAIETVKKYAKNKIVVIISHDGQEGLYDNVIEL